jgi:16S rRNA (guanine966-N2)-methyltransferase
VAGLLRITGGALARRRIAVPAAADAGLVRPTSDKVREAIFASLGGAIEGANVLDVFAGSGALGLEALSRGAARATFIEKDRRTAQTLRENIAALGLEASAQVIVDDATRALAGVGLFDVVFCDPPYALAIDDALARSLGAVVAPNGVLILERGKKSAVLAVPGLNLTRERAYGDTRVLTFEGVTAAADG